jgi:hypothetical protein
MAGNNDGLFVWLFQDFNTFQLAGLLIAFTAFAVLLAAIYGFGDPGNTSAVNATTITLGISGGFIGIGMLMAVIPRFFSSSGGRISLKSR